MSADTRPSPAAKGRGSLLVLVGALMACILALSLTAMGSALLIAQLTQGMAAAVNQSGTLRMQSYRIGQALAAAPSLTPAGAADVQLLANELTWRIADRKLAAAVPAAPGDPLQLAYARIQQRWADELLPAVERAAAAQYLSRVDGFVDDIHELVYLLESRTERRIRLLWMIQAIALSSTVIVVLLAMVLLRRKVLQPLHVLLHAAEQARSGDFSIRTPFVGTDELGRLGIAMNLMSQGLSELYRQLETRVATKTRDLERSNRSLRLLYRSAQSLEGASLSAAGLRKVLAELRAALGLRSVCLCQRDGHDEAAATDPVAGTDASPSRVDDGGVELRLGTDPDADDCAPASAATGKPGNHRDAAPARPAVRFPIADQQAHYATLWVVPDDDTGLADWQRPVLESWAKQLATALHLRERLRESRQLAVHEERSILARELHDSLAQSLSYLKIQALRLEQTLAAGKQTTPPAADGSGPNPAPALIVADLRAGINSAYRHLRELLTSFRLKVEGEGLHAALESVVAECRSQSDLVIEYDDRLPQGILAPNQEVHVLQIVREALSNVRRHARATRARVKLELLQGTLSVEIADDGIGIGEVSEPWTHHGLGIMRERAGSLGGELLVGADDGRGTLVRLCLPVRPADPHRERGQASDSATHQRSAPPGARSTDI